MTGEDSNSNQIRRLLLKFKTYNAEAQQLAFKAFCVKCFSAVLFRLLNNLMILLVTLLSISDQIRIFQFYCRKNIQKVRECHNPSVAGHALVHKERLLKLY